MSTNLQNLYNLKRNALLLVLDAPPTTFLNDHSLSVTALNFSLKDLPQAAFNQAGKTGATISGASGTYKYIDTIVKVVSSTGIVEQLPIRIIQKE